MRSQVLPFQKPPLLDRLFNRVFGGGQPWFVGFKRYLLEVRGRKSGKLYTMPVDPWTHGGRYLCAPAVICNGSATRAQGGEVPARAARCRTPAGVRAERPPIRRCTWRSSAGRCSASLCPQGHPSRRLAAGASLPAVGSSPMPEALRRCLW